MYFHKHFLFYPLAALFVILLLVIGAYVIDWIAPSTNSPKGEQPRILIYMSPDSYNGNLGGRSGADAKCDLALILGCKINRAFLSVNADDEIRDMPGNYGFKTNIPIYWYNRSSKTTTKLANNWIDMLDGTILSTQTVGTGYLAIAKTGSNWDGALAGCSCNGWTDETNSFCSTYGDSKYSTNEWITAWYASCKNQSTHRCLCQVDGDS